MYVQEIFLNVKDIQIIINNYKLGKIMEKVLIWNVRRIVQIIIGK